MKTIITFVLTTVFMINPYLSSSRLILESHDYCLNLPGSYEFKSNGKSTMIESINSDGTIFLKKNNHLKYDDIPKILSLDQKNHSFVFEQETSSIFNYNELYQFYQQYYKGIKVEGGSFLVKFDCERNEMIYISPHVYGLLDFDVKPTISAATALKKHIGITNQIKVEDVSLTISNKIEDRSRLVYDVILKNTTLPHIQIDANSGELLSQQNNTMGISATTRNYDVVTINDFVQGGVRKLQTPSGNVKIYQGLEINTALPVNPSQWFLSNIPTTTSNITWDNDANIIARQARYVTEIVVDKYEEKLGIIFNNVHVSIQGHGAFALQGSTPANSYLQIGNLTPNTPINGPNAALHDIIAHELGHAYCWQYLDNDEALNNGALTEGLCDVFGTYIEHYINIEHYMETGGTDWINGGDDTEVGEFTDRNHMIKACLTDESISHDRGKSVAHCFYAISQGIDEPGENNDIPALGIETSMNIFKEALISLNFRKAGIEYFARRTLNIAAAQYGGVNSTPYEAISKAWDRVCVIPVCGNVPDLIVSNGQNLELSDTRTFGNITIESGGTLKLINNNFYILPDKGITILKGGTLNLACTLAGCDIGLNWKGITVEMGGNLLISNNTEIYNSSDAIKLANESKFDIFGTLTIIGNQQSNTGITLTGKPNLNITQSLNISNCNTGILFVNPTSPNFSNIMKIISDCPLGIEVSGGHVDLFNFELENCNRSITLNNTNRSCSIANNTLKGNFYIGIDVEDCSDVTIENNIIGSLNQRGTIGVQSAFSTVSIYNENHIYAKARCINTYESNVSILWNYLNVADNFFWLFNKTRGCIISGANKLGSSIQNNFLVTQGVHYGIFSEYESTTNISYNDIDFKAPHGPQSAAIDVSGIIGGTIEGNIIDGNPWARGLQLQNSMGTDIHCNDIANANVSLNILHNSDNHDIKANTLFGTDDLNIRSVIGPQPSEGNDHHGNKFEGGTVNTIGLSEDAVFQSQFRVEPLFPYLPPNRTPAIGWFIPEQNIDKETCQSLGVTPGPGWTPNPMRLCTYYTYLKSIKDSLPERFFINMIHLLKYEKRNPNFTIPPCIKNDSTLLQLCGLLKLADISTTLDTLGTHHTLTADVRNLRAQYIQTTDPTTKLNLEQSITAEWTAINLKLPAEKLKDSLKLDSLKGALNNILCDALIVKKWKEIYKLYINFKQHKAVMPSDTNAVRMYSSECADLYGDAIHLARVMASSFTDDAFTSNDDCISVAVPRSIETKESVDNITVYPNPSNGLVTINLPEKYEGHFSVYNSLGQIFLQRKINGEHTINIDISSQYGLNMLHFRDHNGEVKVIKVVIVR